MKTKQNIYHVIFWIIVFSVVAGIMNKVTAQIPEFKVKKGWSYTFVSEQTECKTIEKTAYVLEIKDNYVFYSYRYGMQIDYSTRYRMKYDSFIKMVTNQK